MPNFSAATVPRGRLVFLALILLVTWQAAWTRTAIAQKAIAAKGDARLAAEIDQALQAKINETGAVGMAVGVIRDQRVVLIKTYGLADREANTPVTRETMFRWASCSKPITAVAAMQLVERGALGLDDDVRQYVPEFPEQATPVTVRQLLCHQGGIVHYSNGQVIATPANYDTPHPFADVVVALDKFKASPLVATPGTRYSYTTHGYILLSAVVQRAGKKPFAEQIDQRIIKPARLRSLQPDYQWVEIPHRAVGYRRKGGEVVRSADEDVSWKLGGGGYISNIEDFAGFAAALLNGAFLAPATYELMWTPQCTSDGTETDYGLGFNVTRQKGGLRVSHNGSQDKTRTRLVIYPEKGTGVVVMTNSEWIEPGDFSTAVYKVLK